ncbi:MAG: hypothetical protein JXR96_00475 [Deltaproteobacteria bacterium]|nr:hypothetical protein [Deltaproteobacteria bacterium]
MRVRAVTSFVLALMCACCMLASAQDAEPAGQGDADALRLRGRGMFRYEVRQRDKFDGWSDEIEVHRARFDARWRPMKDLRLLLELELTDGVAIRDIFARYDLHRAFRVKVGHFKKPFSALRMRSRWDLLIPRRGLLDKQVIGSSAFGGFGSRDAGLEMSGRIGKRKRVRFSYHVGLFDGWRLTDAFFRDPDDPDEPNTSHRDYAARLQLDLFKIASLGVCYNHKRARVALAPGSEMDRSFNAVSADVELELAGASLQIEGTYAANPNAVAGHSLLGGHAIASYRLRLADWLVVIPAFMAEIVDPDDELEGGRAWRLAGAVNLDIGAHTRVVLAAEGGFGDMVWTEQEYTTWDEPTEVESAPRPVDTRILVQLNVRL